MRITLEIPDFLYRALKKEAAQEGLSVKDLVLRGIEIELATKSSVRRRRPPVIDSDKRDILDLDNAKIYDIISFP